MLFKGKTKYKILENKHKNTGQVSFKVTCSKEPKENWENYVSFYNLQTRKQKSFHNLRLALNLFSFRVLPVFFKQLSHTKLQKHNGCDQIIRNSICCQTCEM